MEKFRLEKVFQLKKSQLQQKQIDLAQLLQQKEVLQKEIDNKKALKQKYWKIEYLRNPIYQGYFEKLEEEIEELQSQMTELESQIIENRQALLYLYQECKKFEILKERFQADCFIRAKRKEEKAINEIIANRRFHS